MCEVTAYDGRMLTGRLRFDVVGDRTVELRVGDEPVTIIVDGSVTDGDASASDFTFECRHGEGPWEPIDLSPPPGQMLVIPPGSVVRGTPKDPDYVLPEPSPPRLNLGGMI